MNKSSENNNVTNDKIKKGKDAPKESSPESVKVSKSKGNQKNSNNNGKEKDSSKVKIREVNGNTNNKNVPNGDVKRENNVNGKVKNHQPNDKKSNQKASNTSNKPLKSALKTKVPEKETKDGEIKLNIDETKKIVENGKAKPPVESKKVAIAENNVKEANIEKKETKMVENSILNATLESKEISPDEIKVIPNGDEKQQSQQNTEKSSDANQTAGTDEIKKSETEQNQKVADTNENQKNKTPLVKQSSKLDMRRRSSVFGKSMKKNSIKKPERPTPEKFLEVCKKGSWNSVEKIMNELAKDDKYEPDIADTDSGYGPIMYATKSGKADFVEKMISYGFDVNLKDKDGLTALHLAARSNRDDIIRLLMVAKADPMVCGGPKKEYPIHTLLKKMRRPSVGSLPLLLKAQPEEMRLIQDGDGYIALMYAVESQNFGICRELLSLVPKEQLEKKRKKFGDTVLHIATRKRDLEMVRLLREYGVDINSQNKEGSTPLHMVANDADDTWVRFLHNQGADPNIGDAQERTPLFLMVEKGSHRRLDYMIEKFGASINVRTKDGKTLVHAASKSRTLELPMSFIKKGIPIRMQDRSGSRAIHIAAQTGHVDLVKNLLSRGEDVQAKNNDGYTPLHVAVEAGKDEVTEILIANRADVNLTAEKGLEKPIHIAARCPTGKECVVLLIKSGAEINALNEIGRTPLMIAAEAGNLDTLCLLLDIHANIDIIDKNGENVFHIAVKMCHYQVAKQLLETIKNWRSETHVKNVVNQQNPQGEASLHYCAKLLPSNAHYESEEKHVTKLLIESGGDLVKEDFDKGDTPVHYCSRFGTDSVLEEIIRLTATVEFPLVVNKPSKNGFTPLLYACNHGHVGIIKQLLQHHARVDVFDEKGRAGLHLAAELGHHAIMDVLLENKAFVNVRNKFGMTPLHLAAKNGFTSMVQDLIKKYGAQVDPVTLNKQTPLHMAAEFGQLETCGILLELGADMRSVDNRKQTPLHLAAESNHSEVFRLFLEKNPDLLSSVNTNGQTCAHISAEKGSVSVMEELLKFDKETAIRCKIKNTEFTALHQAAEKGHSEVVKLLLDAGAPTNEESSDGMTALHLAARYGHLKVLEALEGLMDLKTYSRRNGLTALHVAASYGQADFVSELLTKVPGNILSQRGTIDPEGETDVTPLHLAAKSGHESVVRMLMNSTGVQIESVTRNTGMTPMHYAAEGGHIIVGGLLISRSNNLMYQQDKHGRTCMHHAAAHGHAHMITMLLGQGAEMEPLDKKNWTPLHHAARNGHLEVVKLLVEAGADSDAVNIDGKNAICLATGAGHTEVLSYLSTIEHDSNSLMEDRNFLMDLMFSSKNHENKPIHEFILTADAPIYVAVKLARCFENLANRDKDKAKDFTAAAQYCDSVAIDLLNVISTNYSTTGLLRAVDMKGTEFLDVLIELERKNVVSQHAVQKFLSRVWIGELQWSSSKFFGFFLTLIFCPFAWIYVSSPFNRQHLDRIPVIKFMSYLTAHILFIFLLCSILLWPTISIPYYQCCIPQWNEWLLILWLIGLLVSDLTNPKDRTGLGNIKTCIMAFGFAGIVVHLFTFFLNLFLDDRDVILSDEWKYKRSDALYVRNQIWAWALLFSFIDFLNFLTVHPLFGPWGVIIVDIIQDILKFVAVLIIFVAGFTLHICAIYQPVYRSHLNQTFPTVGQNFIYPARTLEMLTYALLGHVQMDDMPGSHLSPTLAKILMKIMFGIYMTVTIIVLINLLIAMMSNTYSRIEEQSDIEWKFGRAKLIQNMNRTLSTPSPLNLFIGIPFMLRDRMKKDDKNKTEKRVKSAKSGVYSQYLDVDDKSAILSRRGSRTSIGTSKTMLMDDGGSKKEITKIVNWQAVIRKYHASKGAAQGKDDQED